MQIFLTQKFSKNFVFELQGNFINDIFKYYKITVEDCKDDPKYGRVCQSKEKLNEYLKKNENISLRLY